MSALSSTLGPLLTHHASNPSSEVPSLLFALITPKPQTPPSKSDRGRHWLSPPYRARAGLAPCLGLTEHSGLATAGASGQNQGRPAASGKGQKTDKIAGTRSWKIPAVGLTVRILDAGTRGQRRGDGPLLWAALPEALPRPQKTAQRRRETQRGWALPPFTSKHPFDVRASVELRFKAWLFGVMAQSGNSGLGSGS